MTNHAFRPNCDLDKKVEGKKWGSTFFNFLIRALLRPQIAIRIFAIFSRVIFSLFWPLKIEISRKKLYGDNLLNFWIQALLRQIAIGMCVFISCVIFSLFWPLKIQISQKKLYSHNPLGVLNHIGFQNFKKVDF